MRVDKALQRSLKAINRRQAVSISSPVINSATRTQKLSLSTSTSPRGHQPTVHKDIHGVTGQFVERHDGAAPKLQDIFQQHVRAAEFDLNVEFDVAQQIQGGLFFGRRCASEIPKRKRR